MNFIFNKKLLYCYIVILLIGFLFSVNLAQGSIMGDLENCDCDGVDCSINQTTECGKYCCGDYELNDFVQVFVRYYDRIFGLIGSVALLFFIYGGIIFLISAGNSEKVEQGKKILIGAIIGLVIVFASYTITQFVFTALEIPGTEAGNWATTGWFK